jgi:hypothetical protein
VQHCALCNEAIEQVEIDFGDAFQLEEEFWHTECYAEYFDEVLEEA